MVEADSIRSVRPGISAAMRTERLHSLLRRIPDADWARLRPLLEESFADADRARGFELFERLFRKGEAVGPGDGAAVCKRVESLSGSQPVLAELKKADERLKQRVRWTLREISEEAWSALKAKLAARLGEKAEALVVAELVFRFGESVSNIETAAEALAERCSARRRLAPDVARKNAMLRVRSPGPASLDPEAIYNQVLAETTHAEQVLRRAENTLAYRFVQPTAPFRHARNTVFQIVEALLSEAELRAEVLERERELLAVPLVSREQMRWALHRLPRAQRIEVLKRVPLNTVLMFHESGGEDVLLRATRDRRLGYDLFVEEHSEEELAARYGLALNALKNVVGTMLEALVAKPLARQPAHALLSWAAQVPPMTTGEVRRRLKQLNPGQRAGLLKSVPLCAWKVREIIPLHKHLFLDYLSGEWVLGALVKYYNLHKQPGFAGRFDFKGTLTARRANAAIEAVIHKLADEAIVRHQLRVWSGAGQAHEAFAAGDDGEEVSVQQLMPAVPEALALADPAC
ncbi:MAG TPA: hypothetical protein VG167_06065 [Verrucomicrobiae bacterium]|nr:hypothetical protein [Verrucomicrobiae bacterium]